MRSVWSRPAPRARLSARTWLSCWTRTARGRSKRAMQMAERLRPFDLYWLEEPCWPPENYAALAEVRRAGGVRIAAGENNTSATGFLHMFEAGAVDFAQPSPAKLGGISETRKVFALAQAYNVQLAPHTPYFGPGLLAGMQLNAAH